MDVVQALEQFLKDAQAQKATISLLKDRTAELKSEIVDQGITIKQQSFDLKALSDRFRKTQVENANLSKRLRGARERTADLQSARRAKEQKLKEYEANELADQIYGKEEDILDSAAKGFGDSIARTMGECTYAPDARFMDLVSEDLHNRKDEYRRFAPVPNACPKQDATKYDSDKPEFHLIPTEPLAELGKLYMFGAKKYAPHNWKKGMKYSRVFNALMRHLCAWWDGEKDDAETECHHLASVAWCAFTLIWYENWNRGLDDRYKGDDNA